MGMIRLGCVLCMPWGFQDKLFFEILPGADDSLSAKIKLLEIKNRDDRARALDQGINPTPF